MFERFTERARQVVVLAQEESRGLHHAYIGTEHILLGLLREEEGLGARVLNSFDVTADKVREDVKRIAGFDEEAEIVSGQIPFTPRGKKVLELSLREALSLGHNYIGTEHILLGLVRENEGAGIRILLEAGLDAEKIRNEVIRMLSGPRRADAHEYSLEGELRKQIAKPLYAVVGPNGVLVFENGETLDLPVEHGYDFGDKILVTFRKEPT